MANQHHSIFRKTYLTVSPLEAAYYKKVWLEQTGLSERTFRNRLLKPELYDVLLFSHVCKKDLGYTLKPYLHELRNIPPYNENLQLTLS